MHHYTKKKNKNKNQEDLYQYNMASRFQHRETICQKNPAKILNSLGFNKKLLKDVTNILFKNEKIETLSKALEGLSQEARNTNRKEIKRPALKNIIELKSSVGELSSRIKMRGEKIKLEERTNQISHLIRDKYVSK